MADRARGLPRNPAAAPARPRQLGRMSATDDHDLPHGWRWVSFSEAAAHRLGKMLVPRQVDLAGRRCSPVATSPPVAMPTKHAVRLSEDERRRLDRLTRTGRAHARTACYAREMPLDVHTTRTPLAPSTGSTSALGPHVGKTTCIGSSRVGMAMSRGRSKPERWPLGAGHGGRLRSTRGSARPSRHYSRPEARRRRRASRQWHG